MHVLAKFHVSNYFLQKVTPKTKKKSENEFFMKMLKNLKKSKKSILA